MYNKTDNVDNQKDEVVSDVTKTAKQEKDIQSKTKVDRTFSEKKTNITKLIKPLPLRSESAPSVSPKEPMPSTTNATISSSNNASSISTSSAPVAKIQSPRLKGLFNSSSTIYFSSSTRNSEANFFSKEEDETLSPRISPQISPKTSPNEHTKESPKNERRKLRSNSLASRRKKISQSQDDLKINIGFFLAPHMKRKSAPNIELDEVHRKNLLKEAKKCSQLEETLFIKTNNGDQIIVMYASGSVNKKEKSPKYYYVKREVCLGKGGATGDVVAGIDLESSEIIALRLYKRKEHKVAYREQENLIRMNRFYGLVENCENLMILMEYHPGINFLHYLYEIDTKKNYEDLDYYAQKKLVPPQLIIKIVYKMLEQVQKLHENHLLHRDIKTENFIINFLKDDLEMTLIDLVDAIKDDEESKVHCGTPGYIHPDLLGIPEKRKNYNHSMDYYQLGIVIAELLTSCNYQKELKEKMQKMKDAGFIEDITSQMIFAMMSDVFTLSSTICQKNIEKSTPTAYSLLYDHYVFSVLQQLVMKLIQPGNTLIVLQDEIDKLIDLEKVYYNCAKTMIQLSLDSIKLFSTLNTSMESFGVSTGTKSPSQTFLEVFMTLMKTSFTKAKDYPSSSPESQRRSMHT